MTPSVLDFRRHDLRFDDSLTGPEARDFDCITTAIYRRGEDVEKVISDLTSNTEVARLPEQDAPKWD